MVDFGVQRFQNQSFRGKSEPSYLWMPRCIVLAGLMTGLILGYVWSQDAITGSSYRIEELRQKNTQLADAIGALRAEQSSLVTPEKIDRLAAELGLGSLQPGRGEDRGGGSPVGIGRESAGRVHSCAQGRT